MDYMTKPLSREKIRKISNYIRPVFNLNSDEPFPVLHILEHLSDIFKGSDFSIVEDYELPNNVFAWCNIKPKGGVHIDIKQTVYDGAYKYNNRAFLCFICHEICHVILFYLGYTPVSARALKEYEKPPAYYSVEWQAKALCGELMIPYNATRGMSVSEIIEKYNVSKLSAEYRVNHQ